MRVSAWFGLLFLVVCGFSCSGQRGRIMEDAEEDVVGDRRAGAGAYDRLIQGAVQKLLGEHSATVDGGARYNIAVMSVENAGSEELLDWQEQIYELISTSVNQSKRYRTVSKRYIDAGLRETRLRADDLFLPRYRREFLQILEAQGSPIDGLLFPKLTTGTTDAGLRQRNYVLSLEMVDVETGWNEKVSERIRKEYEK